MSLDETNEEKIIDQPKTRQFSKTIFNILIEFELSLLKELLKISFYYIKKNLHFRCIPIKYVSGDALKLVVHTAPH